MLQNIFLLISLSFLPLNADVASFISWLNEFNRRNRDELINPTKNKKEEHNFSFDDDDLVSAPSLSDFQGTIPQPVYDILEKLKGNPFYDAAPMPKGILFVGKPGTGKTSMARALAHDAGIPFIAVAASEFVCLYVGQGAENIRRIFSRARDRLDATGAQYLILFIDEIDALGNREQTFGSDTETRRTINELLNQMDGFKKDSRIIVIGATNAVNLVDAALRRPGRFDYVIEIPLPDAQAREKILIHYLFNAKYKYVVDMSVNVTAIVAGTSGFSGAELESIVKKAALFAARNQRSMIIQDDLDAAYAEMRTAHNNRR